jgi:predicted GNAT family acetyltransferase
MPSTPSVQHESGEQRFALHLPDGSTAVLAYAPVGGDVIDLQHTVVPPEHRDQGLGQTLVRGALAWARENGKRVMPTCPFVLSYLEEHPEERELVAGG